MRVDKNGLCVPENADDERFLQSIGEIRNIVAELRRKIPPRVHFWAGNEMRFDPECGCEEGPFDGQTLDRENVTCSACLNILNRR